MSTLRAEKLTLLGSDLSRSMLVRRTTTILMFVLSAPVVAQPASPDWGPLEGSWTKLPIACGRDLESTCGGDRFTLKAGTLTARKSCAGVTVVVRGRTQDSWHVEVVGKKGCVWNSGRVRSFDFTIGPGPDRLRFVAYSGATAVPGEELFRGYGFERD